VYFAQKQNTFWTVYQQRVLFRNNTFHNVHQKCGLCTETAPLRSYDRNVNCAQEQNKYWTLSQKCVLCTETMLSTLCIRKIYCAQKQRFPHCASEMCTVHRNRTLSRPFTHKAVFTDQKKTLKFETQPFTVTPIYQQTQLAHNKSHT